MSFPNTTQLIGSSAGAPPASTNPSSPGTILQTTAILPTLDARIGSIPAPSTPPVVIRAASPSRVPVPSTTQATMILPSGLPNLGSQQVLSRAPSLPGSTLPLPSVSLPLLPGSSDLAKLPTPTPLPLPVLNLPSGLPKPGLPTAVLPGLHLSFGVPSIGGFRVTPPRTSGVVPIRSPTLQPNIIPSCQAFIVGLYDQARSTGKMTIPSYQESRFLELVKSAESGNGRPYTSSGSFPTLALPSALPSGLPSGFQMPPASLAGLPRPTLPSGLSLPQGVQGLPMPPNLSSLPPLPVRTAAPPLGSNLGKLPAPAPSLIMPPRTQDLAPIQSATPVAASIANFIGATPRVSAGIPQPGGLSPGASSLPVSPLNGAVKVELPE